MEEIIIIIASNPSLLRSRVLTAHALRKFKINGAQKRSLGLAGNNSRNKKSKNIYSTPINTVFRFEKFALT